MAHYRVMTPDTPRAAGRLCADFEQTTEVDSPVCVRHLLARHDFTGCTVWRRRHNHWSVIFDTSGEVTDYSDPAGAWQRCEAAQ